MKYSNQTQIMYHLLTACAVLMLSLTASAATKAGDDLLANERWESRSEGLSLRPPLGSELLELSGDDTILRIGHAKDYKITLYIKRSTRDVTLEEVVKTAVEQVATSPRMVRKVQPPTEVMVGPLQGQVFAYAVPEMKPPLLLVQAFAMLDPRKVLIVELNTDPQKYEQSRTAFDQVLASIRFEKPEELAKKREAEIQASQDWLKTITPQTIHKALIPLQWFRMLDKAGHDIGYMRITQEVDTTLGHKGIQVDVQSRLILNQVAYDTLANYFASDDMDEAARNEVWSVRTTARPQAGAPKGTAEQSWAETGLLSKGVLSLTRQSPLEKKPYEWESLPVGYLSQAHARVLASLLGPADTKTMAFYVYYATTGKLALRTIRVQTDKGGRYEILTRSSPEQEEEVSYYDAKGNLLRTALPGGQSLVPATAQEIISRWKLKQ